MTGFLPWGRLRGQVNDPVVDIERLIVDYAWNEIADTSCMDRLLRDRRYLLEVNWSYFDISHNVTSFKPRQREMLQTSDSTEKSTTSSPDKARSRVLARDLCLFRTEFKNASPNLGQTFTFRTQRTTTSRCEVSLQRSFRIGGNVNVNFSVPSMWGVTGGLSGELQVTKTSGQSFEEVLTWSVDSQVNVEPKSRAVAQLLVREEELNADMTIESIIRPLYDRIPVYVKSKKSFKSLELLEILSSDLPEILNEQNGFEKVDDWAVKRETKGVTRFVYGAQQTIDLKTFPLDPAEISILPLENEQEQNSP